MADGAEPIPAMLILLVVITRWLAALPAHPEPAPRAWGPGVIKPAQRRRATRALTPLLLLLLSLLLW